MQATVVIIEGDEACVVRVSSLDELVDLLEEVGGEELLVVVMR